MLGLLWGVAAWGACSTHKNVGSCNGNLVEKCWWDWDQSQCLDGPPGVRCNRADGREVAVHYMPWFEIGKIHFNYNAKSYTRYWNHSDLCFPGENFPGWYPPRDGLGNPMPRFNSYNETWAEEQVVQMAQYCLDGVIIDFGPQVNNDIMDRTNIFVTGTEAIVAALVKAGMKFSIMVDCANWGGPKTYQDVWDYAIGLQEQHPNNVFKDKNGRMLMFMFGATDVPPDLSKYGNVRFISQNGWNKGMPSEQAGYFGWSDWGFMDDFHSKVCSNYCVGAGVPGMESLYFERAADCMLSADRLRDSLRLCLNADSYGFKAVDLCQVQTWNDYNEGTNVALSGWCDLNGDPEKANWRQSQLLEVVRDIKLETLSNPPPNLTLAGCP
eukprot:Hpha_TRINITY_DN26652_c0_g1::TRINITY_DN26652_c0_g1_i1::g.86042::m.86042